MRAYWEKQTTLFLICCGKVKKDTASSTHFELAHTSGSDKQKYGPLQKNRTVTTTNGCPKDA